MSKKDSVCVPFGDEEADMKKRSCCSPLMMAFFFVVLAVVAEVYLWQHGFPLNTSDDRLVSGANGCDGDWDLGWVNRPGALGADLCNGAPAIVWSNRQRASRRLRDLQRTKQVALLGCSFTFGLGVTDSETYPWLLNEMSADISFDNYGVRGYGAYQCLLTMKRILEREPQRYQVIVYSCISDHMLRDYYDDFREGNLVYTGLGRNFRGQRRLRHHHWLGDCTLRSINLLRNVYRQGYFETCICQDRFHSMPRRAELMGKLILSMADLAKEHKIAFLVCDLQASEDKCYADMVQEVSRKGIAYNDCSLPREPDAEGHSFVLDDGFHPNARGHRVYADRIAHVLAQVIGKASDN